MKSVSVEQNVQNCENVCDEIEKLDIPKISNNVFVSQIRIWAYIHKSDTNNNFKKLCLSIVDNDKWDKMNDIEKLKLIKLCIYKIDYYAMEQN